MINVNVAVKYNADFEMLKWSADEFLKMVDNVMENNPDAISFKTEDIFEFDKDLLQEVVDSWFEADQGPIRSYMIANTLLNKADERNDIIRVELY